MIRDKMPALNGRFGASGGVFSADSGWVTSSFALVRAFTDTPASVKPQVVARKRITVRRTLTADKETELQNGTTGR